MIVGASGWEPPTGIEPMTRALREGLPSRMATEARPSRTTQSTEFRALPWR